MTVYVALLRGINVGGKNPIKMAELAALFRSLGFGNVQTYIQSGNVVFAADDADKEALSGQLEEALSAAFAYEARLVLRSHAEMHTVVSKAPPGFGGDPAAYRYDVLFLKEPVAAAEVVKVMPVKAGVDQTFAGAGVIYTSRLIARAAQSAISRIAGLPFYQNLTIRNWNTTTRLLHLMQTPRD